MSLYTPSPQSCPRYFNTQGFPKNEKSGKVRTTVYEHPSSGAMMTNILLGAYPDVFAAGTAFDGVTLGCFAAPDGSFDYWSSDCATGLGTVRHTD